MNSSVFFCLNPPRRKPIGAWLPWGRYGSSAEVGRYCTSLIYDIYMYRYTIQQHRLRPEFFNDFFHFKWVSEVMMSSFFFEAFIIEVFLHISTLGFHVARLQLYCCHDATLRSTCLWCWGVAESVREGWRLEDWCIFFLQEDGRRNRVEKVRTDDHNQWSIFMSHWSIPLLFV